MHKSRLVLGTVQLGMDYGVNNAHGVPSRDEAFAILDAALAGGINTFDTAASYGAAEDILGAWITERGAKDVHVITKIRGDDPEGIRAEIQSSLKRLRIDRLDGCLFHDTKALHRTDSVDSLREAATKGLTSHIGASVYDEADARHALELDMQYVQVPYNALDQRLDRDDFFSAAKEKGVTVFARSPFLQGLLLMDPKRLLAHLSHTRPYLERFIEIAKRRELSQLAAAFGFSYLHCRAEHIVFGVDSLAQLKEILDVAGRTPSAPAPWIDELAATFKDVDRSVVDPRLWKK